MGKLDANEWFSEKKVGCQLERLIKGTCFDYQVVECIDEFAGDSSAGKVEVELGYTEYCEFQQAVIGKTFELTGNELTDQQIEELRIAIEKQESEWLQMAENCRKDIEEGCIRSFGVRPTVISKPFGGVQVQFEFRFGDPFEGYCPDVISDLADELEAMVTYKLNEVTR